MILTEIIGSIGIIKLNRPEKRNSLHPEMIKEFVETIRTFNNDSQVKVIIITGVENSFCAGADLGYLQELRSNSVLLNESDSSLLGSFFLSVYESSKPTIAAVNGPAIAGGCGLATACDFIFADSEKSKFGYSEVKIGFLPAIVSFLLLRRVSEFKAKQLLLTAEIMNAKKAQEIGLIEYISDSEKVLQDSIDFAKELCTNSQFSMSETKKMIRQIYSLRYDDAVKYCLNLNVIGRTSEDFQKGLDKFLNKK
ncbi:MAG: enoyl-CoA hydratase/isomerase family protein [Ignavibacteria bacterium]|jgi:methylglutaconyl-CoA hydratase|nr:enoyl-CoA hydratase/isomerase family protein [Ignavibacteria bacterium]